MNCSAPSIHIATESWAFLHGMFACQAEALGATAMYCEETLPLSATNSIPLTLTDRKGLTNSASTPIVVVTAASTTNKAPTAVATATPSTGTIPLTVSFSETGSTDSDGSISSYVWNFGDGSTATGKTVTYTYTTAANISAILQVTDNKGAKSITSIPITVNSLNGLTDLNIELGEVTVTHQWVHVLLTSTFTNPIVVTGPPSFKGSNPCVVRLRNISRTGFDIRVAEWNYLDGVHVAETVNYLVMEKGRTTLPDVSMIEAGSFAGTTSFKNVTFSKSFVKKPVSSPRSPLKMRQKRSAAVSKTSGSNPLPTTSGSRRRIQTPMPMKPSTSLPGSPAREKSDQYNSKPPPLSMQLRKIGMPKPTGILRTTTAVAG